MGLLDKDGFCSLFVAVDQYYLDKLCLSYPTWVECHPEIIRMPHIFVVDEQQINFTDPRWGKIQKAREAAAARNNISLRDTIFQVVNWSMDHSQGITQREEMLTGLIRRADHIKTPWYLKLDADTFATEKKGFYYDKWFRGNPCYIANSWNYTRPAGTVAKMNEWAKGVPELKDLPDVQFTSEGEGPRSKDKHRRMASWTMFGDTRWTQWASGLCTDARLPFPSQDTYLSFIQAKTSALWVANNFRKMGMDHAKNMDALTNSCHHTLSTLGIL